MFYFLFFAALAVAAGSGFYWYRGRGDTDSVRVYRTIALIAVIFALAAGLHLIPDSFWNENGYWVLPVIDGAFCIGTVCGAVYLVRKRKSVSKFLFAVCLLAYSAVLIVCGASFVRGIESFPSAGENVRMAQAAQAYAENIMVEKLGISRSAITTRANSYASAEKHPVYLIGFAYSDGTRRPEKVYGFHIVTDDAGHCTILEQGEESGRKIIGTEPDAQE